MAAQTVVNELVIDASGATSGASQYAAAMQKAEAAADATISAADKAQAAIDKQTISMTGSYGRQVAQFNRYAAAADPVLKAQQQLERVAAAGQKAIAAGAVSQEQANNVISLYEERLKRAAAAAESAAASNRAYATSADAINARLGIGASAGSAQASADVFLSSVGGLEGVAAARAQQVAQAFTRDLNDRLVTGTGKSARDSSAVFAAEMDHMDALAQQKAQQIGSNFAADLDARLIAGTAKSARDSASVFAAATAPMDAVDKALQSTVGDLNVYAAAQTNGTLATKNAAGEHASLSTQAMAAQHSLRGMITMAVMGVSPMQILGVEASHLAFAAAGPGGLKQSMKEAGSSLLSLFTSLRDLITPMTLMVGLPVAIAGGFAYLYHSIKTTELEFANLSDRIGSTLSQLHGLQSNALLSSGIGESDFLSQMQKFGDSVVQAQHGLGGLAEIFRANGTQAKTFNDYLARAADLVANARSEQEKYRVVQALGLPATQQWVQYLSQGGDAIARAANEANGWGDASEREMIAKARKFDTEWAKTWQNFKDEAKQAILDASSWMDRLGPILRSGVAAVIGKDVLPVMGRNMLIDKSGTTSLSQNDANSFYNTFGNTFTATAGMSGGKTTVLPADVKNSLQLEQQRLSILGQLQTIQDKVRLSEIQINEARLNGVRVTGQEEIAILNIVRTQAEWSRINEASQIGIFNVADAAKAAADQLRAWQDQGLIDPHNAQEMAAAHQVLADKIKASADAAALAATPYKQLKQMEIDYADSSKMIDSAAASSLQGIDSGLLDIASHSKSTGDAFRDMGLSIVKALEDMIIKMTIIQPLAYAMRAALGGFGGGSGAGIFSLFGLKDGGSFTIPAGPGALALPGFANGTDFTVPGSGPPDSKVTAFRVSPGERVTVTPPGRTTSSGAGGALQIHVISDVDKNGNIVSLVQTISGQIAGQAVQYAAPGIASQAVSAVANRNKNAPSYIRKAV